MSYVYLLQSRKTGRFYIGSTDDLRQRLHHHNTGQSIATKHDIPWDVVYYEAYTTKALALQREKKLKQYGRGLVEIKKRAGFC